MVVCWRAPALAPASDDAPLNATGVMAIAPATATAIKGLSGFMPTSLWEAAGPWHRSGRRTISPT